MFIESLISLLFLTSKLNGYLLDDKGIITQSFC